MFGSNKKRQARSVEEFLSGRDAGTSSVDSGAVDKETGAPKTKTWLVAPAVVAGGLLVLLFAAFVKINGLKSDVAQVRLQASKELANKEFVESLKAQVDALSSKVDKSNKEAAQLKADIAGLGKDLGAVKLQSMRRQKAEVAAKKPAVDKKKALKPAGRSM